MLVVRHEFRLADIGEGLEEAEIVRWFVAVGDRVERDQPLIEVMTDKSNAELPAPEAGTVVQVGGEVGDLLEVGELIAVIETEIVPPSSGSEGADQSDDGATGEMGAVGDAGESSSPAAAFTHNVAEVVADAPAAVAEASDDTDDAALAPIVADQRPKASPSTRRAAAERGIDLQTVQGTGPGGRILLSDLDAAPNIDPAPSVADTTAPEAGSPEPAAMLDAPGAPQSSSLDESTSDGVPAPDAGVDVLPDETQTLPDTTSQPVVGADADMDPESGRAEPSVESEIPAGTEEGSESGALEVPADHPGVPGAEPADRTIALRGVRRVVARNMAQSWSQIPHIHAFDEIDAEPLLALRERLRTTGKATYDHVTPLTFFVAAVARALRAHPEANSSVDMQNMTITRHGAVNVGVAVAAEHGLVVPVLRNADRLDFADLTQQLARLVQGARDGLLAAEHFRGGTVTVTNFGSLGGMQATPIIRAPEATIFGFGAVARRPFVLDDQVVARNTLPTVVGADHRLIDGDVATAVLHAVGQSLLDPLQLVL